MSHINYVRGDATSPEREGNKVMVHVCNDVGGWGRGFVMALSAKWPQPEAEYRKWAQSGEGFLLGETQFVQVEPDTWVANMIGQRDVRKDKEGNPPVRYEAIESALNKVADFVKTIGASVHMPRIGCGLAGGTWDKMEPVIMKALVEKGVEVYVYDL